tara:strand:+ start:553 stop:1224 length:672 start_codon:yes stop_codon:yes gene_type:complete
MKILLVHLALILTLTSCSNTSELETGEIKTLQLLKQVFEQPNSSKIFIDSRDILSRKKVDAANTPLLFVELKSGQNGTLTPYPGQGIGQTWLGADGATITMERGILKASRGMGDDLMGSSSSMPAWSKIDNDIKTYKRELIYTSGNNKILKHSFKCSIEKNNRKEVIKIWDINFSVTKFKEHCSNNEYELNNTYYVDDRKIVRRASQYHSETIGYILTERLDR